MKQKVGETGLSQRTLLIAFNCPFSVAANYRRKTRRPVFFCFLSLIHRLSIREEKVETCPISMSGKTTTSVVAPATAHFLFLSFSPINHHYHRHCCCCLSEWSVGSTLFAANVLFCNIHHSAIIASRCHRRWFVLFVFIESPPNHIIFSIVCSCIHISSSEYREQSTARQHWYHRLSTSWRIGYGSLFLSVFSNEI